MTTQPDSVNTGALATIVVILALAVAGIAAGVTALVRHQTDAIQEDKRAGLRQRVKQFQTQQLRSLQAAKTPIDRAMHAVVRDLRQDPMTATPGAVALADSEELPGALPDPASAASESPAAPINPSVGSPPVPQDPLQSTTQSTRQKVPVKAQAESVKAPEPAQAQATSPDAQSPEGAKSDPAPDPKPAQAAPLKTAGETPTSEPNP